MKQAATLAKELQFIYVPSKSQVADILTKNQSEEIHSRSCDYLMGKWSLKMIKLHANKGLRIPSDMLSEAAEWQNWDAWDSQDYIYTHEHLARLMVNIAEAILFLH